MVAVPVRSCHSLPSCCCLVIQFCPILCDPMDCSLPGSSVHGIFQARILKWVVTTFSRGSSPPRDWTCVSFIGRWVLYPLNHQGSPPLLYSFFISYERREQTNPCEPYKKCHEGEKTGETRLRVRISKLPCCLHDPGSLLSWDMLFPLSVP